MNAAAFPKPFTYDDYLALPDDGKRYEIIEGEVSVTPAPTPRHQTIQLRLGSLLLAYLDRSSMGRVFVSPIDLALSMVDVVQPDILFVARDRAHIIAKKNIVGIPNLIVEILSPSSTTRDQREKLKLYQRYGLPEYWIVDPETKRVAVYLFGDGRLNKSHTLKAGQQVATNQMPGLTLEVAEIFK
jgi:Uma2 family endonuclease